MIDRPEIIEEPRRYQVKEFPAIRQLNYFRKKMDCVTGPESGGHGL